MKGGSTGGYEQTPKCFVLSDQCFPPVLPSTGNTDCLAIVQIEDGTLMELASAFLDLANGYDVPVGSVVVLSSTSMLLRAGPATYAEKMVRSFARIRDAYKGSVRVVHGFPVLVEGVENEVLI